MKVLVLLLKIVGALSILLAVMAFGSDLLPVEGVDIGGNESVGGDHQYYKIVPTDGVNPIPIGVAFMFVGIGLFLVSALLKKYFVK